MAKFDGKCKSSRHYKGIRKPKCGCAHCEHVWYQKQRDRAREAAIHILNRDANLSWENDNAKKFREHLRERNLVRVYLLGLEKR